MSSTPPRKQKNPENIFLRGMNHNIRARHENVMSGVAAEQEETAEQRFERFLEEGVHPSTLTYRDFEPGLYENVNFFNENGGLVTPEMMGMELFEEYRMAYAERYGRRNAPRITKKKRTLFNNALNQANKNVAPSTPTRVHSTLTEPPAIMRQSKYMQRYFEENENENENNNARSTNGFGKGGKRRSAKRSTRKTRRAHHK